MAGVLDYVGECTSLSLPVAECGPVWQLGVIVFFLVCAVCTLIALRLSSRAVAQD